tara:strand:+ start:3570 stop:4010 length:441 start_codon:yes stop_codon:yes gene_type:complete
LLNNSKSVFIFVGLSLVVGSLASSNASSDLWYQSLIKSNLNPPGYIFGIVWPILYFLMSISAYRTFESTKNLFFVQLFLNTIWSWLFFSFQMPLISLLDIYILIFLNIIIFIKMLKEDIFSGLIYLPYLIWLIFASYLNIFIVLNN